MTSFGDLEALRCAVCGRESRQTQLASTNTHGAPDLDTRPPEMLRSTIRQWVQECPHCGHAAPDISVAEDGAEDIVGGEAYRAIEGKFQRHSWLLAQLGHYADAGWVSLHAAWVADDEGDEAIARQCRGRAVELWKRGKQNGQSFMETTEQEFALVADLLRRSGNFAEAKETCLSGLDEGNLTPLIADALRFQLTLISRQNTVAHTMAELPKRPQGGERITLT